MPVLTTPYPAVFCMTPQDFIAKWGLGGPAHDLNEEQGAQSHFLDLCELLDVPKPGSASDYRFEEKSKLIGGRTGYADVFMRGVFAWENKAPGKNLDAALKQLLSYSLALDNPPLLVVCDRLTLRLHTQFTGYPSETHTVQLAELSDPAKRALLRRIWTDPHSFRPRRSSRDITETAAKSFATLAEQLRGRDHHPDKVAHFLTQCLFCFFAEDVGLLPGRMFERLVSNRHLSSERLTVGLANLFTVMRDGGLYGVDDIPWFNGGLFKQIDVPRLEILDITELRNAAALNWSAIDVSIFGTLFERGLDPAKRSQLGAHYTDPTTIERIIDPVLRRPLQEAWAQAAEQIQALLLKSRRRTDKAFRDANAVFVAWLDKLAAFRVLDPACGSGNFLFLALKCLKDLELATHLHAATLGLDRQTDLVTGPHNVLGIELNEYAAELARVTVWIGELQWRQAHGYEFKQSPVLEPLDHIECRDALLVASKTGWYEAAWPQTDVAIGNPPFLGGSKKRRELGDDYFNALRTVYAGRVPGGADLVCYWFERARVAISAATLSRAGLVATQAVRAGSNRVVLTALADSDIPIFAAWGDQPWVNEGAAVRVSVVCFGASSQIPTLDDQPVTHISANLGSSDNADMTTALLLPENAAASFEGTKKYGDFDIPGHLARQWLVLPNPNGQSNALVVKPWRNGQDLTRRPSDTWVVDFGTSMDLASAILFEAPFTHVERAVKPARARMKTTVATHWWLHERPRASLRQALKALPRYIATTRVAKHRIFVFLDASVLPDTRLNLVARADDVTFGLLSSRMHEVWSLAQASMHGVGNDPTYNAKSCFETFPFPLGLTPADTAHQRTEALPCGALIPADLPHTPMQVGAQRVSGAISEPQAHEPSASAAPQPGQSTPAAKKTKTKGKAQLPTPELASLHTIAERIAIAAKRLNDLREEWLNPSGWTRRVPDVVPLGMSTSPYPDRIEPRPGLSEADLKALQQRTLTQLYNLRPTWLVMAHQTLDAAVAAAYEWPDYSPETSDAAILQHLLALNQERAAPA